MGLKDFFASVREGEEPQKLRWVIVFSATAMGVVLFIWLAYVDRLVEAPRERETVEAAADDFSFSAVVDSMKGALGAVKDAFLKPRIYDIVP